VRTTDVQGGDEHGASPIAQPSLELMKVAVAGTKPAGTGPPLGPCAAGACDGVTLADEARPAAVLEPRVDGCAEEVGLVELLEALEELAGAEGGDGASPPDELVHAAASSTHANRPVPNTNPARSLTAHWYPIGTGMNPPISGRRCHIWPGCVV
jgi:hypothetical protein